MWARARSSPVQSLAYNFKIFNNLRRITQFASAAGTFTLLSLKFIISNCAGSQLLRALVPRLCAIIKQFDCTSAQDRNRPAKQQPANS